MGDGEEGVWMANVAGRASISFNKTRWRGSFLIICLQIIKTCLILLSRTTGNEADPVSLCGKSQIQKDSRHLNLGASI